MSAERSIDRVIRLAKVMGKTQGDIAEWCGVQAQAVTNWKARDDMPAKHLLPCAEHLGCSIYDLLGLPADNTDWPFPAIPPARFHRLTAGAKLQVQGVMLDKIAELEQLRPNPKSASGMSG
jgi:hypothetical protein